MKAAKISLADALKSVEKRFGSEAVAKTQKNIKRTSTGSLNVDIALGGGFPNGRVVEIAGWESSGKSSLAIHAAAEVQKTGGAVVYIDTEHAFDPFYANQIGMDVDIEKKNPKLVLSQPYSGEEAFDIAKEFIKAEGVKLIIFDSVSGMTPKAEMEAESGEQKMGLLARLMSKEVPKLVQFADRNDCTVIFINQFREKITMFGNPVTTSGGKALKFYSSIRIEMSQKSKNKDSNGDIFSINSKVKVIKNKTAPPFKETEIRIEFGKGITKDFEILNLAVDQKIIEKKGSWFNYGDVKLGQGEANVIELLQSNTELSKEIEKKILKNLNK